MGSDPGLDLQPREIAPLESDLDVMDSKALARVEPRSGIDVGAVIQSAIASGRPMSEMKEALDLFERMEAIRRESLFNAAFVAFKRACPPIQRRTKDEYITVVTRDGTRKPRMYASLDDIAMTCDPHLHGNGLTYDWLDAELTPNGSIVRRFILRHEAGHSRAPVASPPIPIEGGEAYKKIDPNRKATSASPQQRLGVADTYAKRYSMTAGLGIPTCDEDDDAGGPGVVNGETITEAQQNTLNDLIVDVEANRAKFLQYFHVAKLAEIREVDFDRAVMALNSKPKRKPNL